MSIPPFFKNDFAIFVGARIDPATSEHGTEATRLKRSKNQAGFDAEVVDLLSILLPPHTYLTNVLYSVVNMFVV